MLYIPSKIIKYLWRINILDLYIPVRYIQAMKTITLKEFRKERGISQRDVAIALNLSQPTISKIERGEIEPTLSTAFSLRIGLRKKLKPNPLLLARRMRSPNTTISRANLSLSDEAHGCRTFPHLSDILQAALRGSEQVIHFPRKANFPRA